MTSKFSCLLFSLIVRLVTWVELHGYPHTRHSTDLSLRPILSSTGGGFHNWKNISHLMAHPVHQHTVNPPLFLLVNPTPVNCRLVPHFTHGELRRIFPILMLQEAATSLSKTSPTLWSMLLVVQVIITSLQILSAWML